MSRTLPAQVHLTFNSVAVYFTEEEWRTLTRWQQQLYKDTMNQNYQTVLSLGADIPRPDLFQQIEQWEKLRDGGDREEVTSCVPSPTGLPICELDCPQENPWIRDDRGNMAVNVSLQTEPEPDIIHQNPSIYNNPDMVPGAPLWTDCELSNRSPIPAQCLSNNNVAFQTVSRRMKALQPMCQTCNGIYNCYCNLSSRRSKKYTCIDCGKGYNHEFHLILHQKSHLREGPHQCSMCRKSFLKPGHLRMHRKTHLVMEHPCRHCQEVFHNKGDLVLHRQTHRKVPERRCKQCGETFHSRLDLNTHRKTHRRTYECLVCKMTLGSKSQLDSHRQEHKRQGVYRCDTCLKVYRRAGSFFKHLMVHTAQQQAVADLHRDKLQTKTEIPDGNRNYKLSNNDATRPDRNTMMAITREEPARGSESDPRSSQTLRTQVKEEDVWDQHPSETCATTAAPETLYRCQVCWKRFRHRASLGRHAPSHTMLFPCDLCGQTFQTLLMLYVHRSVHRRNRPHRCRNCTRSFTLRSVLLLHLDTHRPWKPEQDKRPLTGPHTEPLTEPPAHQVLYSCSYCEESFTSRSSLVLHQRTHQSKTSPQPPSLAIAPVQWKSRVPDMASLKDYVKRFCYISSFSRNTK